MIAACALIALTILGATAVWQSSEEIPDVNEPRRRLSR